MSNLKQNGFSIRNYDDAKMFLNGKSERPYAHNTRIQVLDQHQIAARYHGHPIAVFCDDQTVSYSSCGWMTFTTKERINWFLPEDFRLWQEKFMWKLYRIHRDKFSCLDYSHKSEYVWEDGITINVDTLVVSNAGEVTRQDEVKALVKRIKKYALDYADALVNMKVEAPGPGDCMICGLMRDADGNDMGSNHLTLHMDENYFVPSLLVNAYNMYPVCKFTQGTLYEIWYHGVVPNSYRIDILRRDVISSITRFMKHELKIA